MSPAASKSAKADAKTAPAIVMMADANGQPKELTVKAKAKPKSSKASTSTKSSKAKPAAKTTKTAKTSTSSRSKAAT
ncbi:RNA polymerase sigma factor RpoD, partial [Pseudomonas sp. HMWF031]